MTKTYSRIATVEFAINGTDQRVTVSNLPYSWNPRKHSEVEGDAAFEAIRFLREMGMTQGLSLISVVSSPA